MKNKKVLLAIGPFVAALVIIGFIFYSPFNLFGKPSPKAVHESASSMSVNVLKGNALKNKAMESDHYLPFFGSSELSRVNSFHPSVLADKYDRDYEPYLLGAPGTQSLTHFFLINSMKEELKNRKAIFIISPQWFVQEGVSNPMFSMFYSPLHTNQWLSSVDSKDVNDVYLAKRLLSFTSIREDTSLKAMVKKIEKGEPLSDLDKKQLKIKYNMLEKEDLLFGKFGIRSKTHKIKRAEKNLPAKYSYDNLDKLAVKRGETQTDNNEFEISNGFYTKRIMPVKGKLKNSQKDFNYLASPEYADFQLVLDQIAANNMDVLFVIPPVNKRWSDYTGLSQDMLKEFSKKINYQLSSQGFNHVVDYTDKNAEPYFMEDTIHLGWRGWLNLDKDLESFLKDKQKPHCKIDSSEFLSNEWQNRQKL